MLTLICAIIQNLRPLSDPDEIYAIVNFIIISFIIKLIVGT